MALAVAAVCWLLIFSGDDEPRSSSPPASTDVSPTFAVDLSTGAADSTNGTNTANTAVVVPSPTIPLPSLWLPPPEVTLPAGQPPQALGHDADLDALASACYAGNMQACDDLHVAADGRGAYATYGDTCAGRQPMLTGERCVDVFG